MNDQVRHNGVLARPLTCKDCIHAIRHNKKHEVVVCVPHLKNIPSNNAKLCELFSSKNG